MSDFQALSTPSNISYYRLPTKNNPMMNVPIIDYDRIPEYSNYYRYEGLNSDINLNKGPVTKLLDEDWSRDLPMDPGDIIFKKSNFERQWYSMPNGSVPNDQTAFAYHLYGRDYVCKSGSIWSKYNVKYTDDSLVCTGFEGDGNLTNFGLLRK